MKTLYPVSHLILTLALGGRHNIIITLITFNLILQCLANRCQGDFKPGSLILFWNVMLYRIYFIYFNIRIIFKRSINFKL